MPSALAIVTRVLAALLLIVASGASAQTYPQRPVKLVVGHPVGTGVDNAARVLAQSLSAQWGQSVVVENRLGAAGTIAVEAVAASAPDGYTLLGGALPNVILPAATDPAVRFDPVRDFVPVGRIANAPFVIAVGTGVPARSVRDLVDLARTSPGKLTYMSPGRTSLTAFNVGLLSASTGAEFTPIEYKSIANGIVDLVAGRIDFGINDYEVFAAHVQAGTVRALGVVGTQRAARIPDVPTVAEQGFPTVALSLWFGILAPAQVPAETLARIRTGYANAMRSPEVRERLAAFGYEPLLDTPEEFAAVVQRDLSAAREQARAMSATPRR